MAYVPPERRFQCLTAGCSSYRELTDDEVFSLFFRQQQLHESSRAR
jgi:hypothetical protein